MLILWLHYTNNTSFSIPYCACRTLAKMTQENRTKRRCLCVSAKDLGQRAFYWEVNDLITCWNRDAKTTFLDGQDHICCKGENFQVDLRQDCEQASVGACSARGNPALAHACERITKLSRPNVLHRHLLHCCPRKTSSVMSILKC